MKRAARILVAVLLLMLLFSLLPILASANNEIAVTIDGRTVEFDGQNPVILAGRTLVPVRGVFEVLGFQPSWDGSTRTATLTRDDYVVVLTIGSYTFTTNGIAHTMDVPPQIIGGRTLLPLRAVLESVGYDDMDWVAETRTVVIRTGVLVRTAQQVPSRMGITAQGQQLAEEFVLQFSSIALDSIMPIADPRWEGEYMIGWGVVDMIFTTVTPNIYFHDRGWDYGSGFYTRYGTRITDVPWIRYYYFYATDFNFWDLGNNGIPDITIVYRHVRYGYLRTVLYRFVDGAYQSVSYSFLPYFLLLSDEQGQLIIVTYTWVGIGVWPHGAFYVSFIGTEMNLEPIVSAVFDDSRPFTYYNYSLSRYFVVWSTEEDRSIERFAPVTMPNKTLAKIPALRDAEILFALRLVTGEIEFVSISAD